MFEGPIAMSIIFRFKRPKSAKKRPYPSVKPDLSNLTKLLEDAANGILYKDDSAICQSYVQKVYGETDGVTIRVVQIG